MLEDFKYERYDDEYTGKLQKLIQLKVDGEEIVQAPDPEEPKIINLMDALKKSVAEAQSGGAKKSSGSTKKKKMAPSAAKKKPVRRKKSG